jgi:hypothetical protein
MEGQGLRHAVVVCMPAIKHGLHKSCAGSLHGMQALCMVEKVYRSSVAICFGRSPTGAQSKQSTG